MSHSKRSSVILLATITVLLNMVLCSRALLANPWQDLELVGETRFNYLFWKIYDARLYADDQSFSLEQTRPFALEITYNRNFDRESLVGETQRQWEKMGQLTDGDIATLLKDVDRVLVNVDKEDTITLYVDEQGTSHFYHNGKLTGEVSNPKFSLHFASIWLSENSSRPSLTAELLGKS